MKWTIKQITPMITVGKKDTPKCTVIIEELKEEYPNSLAIDVLWDSKIDLLQSFNVWDVVTIEYNTRANEYKDRWFNNITLWRIQKEQPQTKAPANDLEDDEDLPF